MVHPQYGIDTLGARSADPSSPAGKDGGTPSRMKMWLQAGLLAIAPLLVGSFYSVVDGAVERAAERAAMQRSLLPARALQTGGGLRPVAWECSPMPGAGIHNACRPMPVGSLDSGRAAGG